MLGAALLHQEITCCQRNNNGKHSLPAPFTKMMVAAFVILGITITIRNSCLLLILPYYYKIVDFATFFQNKIDW